MRNISLEFARLFGASMKLSQAQTRVQRSIREFGCAFSFCVSRAGGAVKRSDIRGFHYREIQSPSVLRAARRVNRRVVSSDGSFLSDRADV